MSTTTTAAPMPEASLKAILERLEALEARVNQWSGGKDAGKPDADTPPDVPDEARKHWGKPGIPLSSDASATERAADKAADVMEDAAADAVQKLHPALIKFLNRCVLDLGGGGHVPLTLRTEVWPWLVHPASLDLGGWNA